MRNIAIVLAAIVLIASLTACDVSGPSTGATSETAAPAAQATERPTTGTSAPAAEAPAAPKTDELQLAARKIGCTGYAQSSEAAPFVDKWGTCELNGARVQLYLIPSDASYKAFINACSAWGVTEAQMAHVGSIVAAAGDQTLVDRLRASLAG